MSIVGKSSQYYSGFSPTTIPGCALWLDATDSNSLTLSGSNVTAWRDKSGLGNNSTGIVNTPTLRGNSINGYPAVFLSSNAVRGGISPTISSNQLHCFMVVTALSTSGPYPRFLGLDDGVNAEYNSVTGISAIGRPGSANFTASRQNSGASVSAADNVPHIVTSYVISSNQYITVDGSTNFSSASSSTTANFAISKWNLGCETGGSVYWNPQAYVGEVLVFSNALSSNLRYQVEGYLATKWGLRPSIPATHPFKTLAPLTRPFVPVDISGCVLWMDAADSTCLTLSGSNVTTWFDKSGNGRNFTATLGNFTYIQDQGRRVVNVPNTTMMTAASFSFPVTAGVSHVFVVAKVTPTATLANLMSVFPTSKDNDSFRYAGGTANYVGAPAQAGNSDDLLTLNQTYINGAFNTDTTYTNYHQINGTIQVGRTITSITLSSDFMSRHFVGSIAEIIFYTGPITAPERQEVETYLANKWGLRGLTPTGHYARLSPALSTAFLPPQIGTCSVWLDSADLTTLTLSGSNVTAWRDKSGTGANATFVGTNVYSSSARYVQTPGGTGYFSVPCDLRKTPTPRCSLFTVHKWITNTGGNQALWGTDVGGGWNRIQLLPFPGYTPIAFGLSLGNAAPNTYAVNGLNTMSTVMYSAIYDLNVTNGTTAHVNGIQNAIFTEGAATTETSTQLTFFGCGQSGDFYTPIGFSEIIIFRFKLTTQQRQQIEGYLANKWGLTSNLPAGHPFKAAAP